MDKPLNIRRIAELAKCSPSTVSRVLSGRKTNIPISEETRLRVLEVCRKLDYQPSIHALRFFSRQAGVIGFLKDGEMLMTGVDDTMIADGEHYETFIDTY